MTGAPPNRRPELGDPEWNAWLGEQYREAQAFEDANPEYAAEMREWMETGVDECLPDDWDEWRRRYAEWLRDHPQPEGADGSGDKA
jgi:hypothetical protein